MFALFFCWSVLFPVATASTTKDGAHGANNAVGDTPTYWLSKPGDPPHWWQVDLKNVYIDIRVAISWQTSLQSGSTAAEEYRIESSLNSVLWLVQFAEKEGSCADLVRIDEWPTMLALARFIRITSTLSCHIDGIVGITQVVVQGTLFEAPGYELCGDASASSEIDGLEAELVMKPRGDGFWQTQSTMMEAHWLNLDLPAPFKNLYTVLDWETSIPEVRCSFLLFASILLLLIDSFVCSILFAHSILSPRRAAREYLRFRRAGLRVCRDGGVF